MSNFIVKLSRRVFFSLLAVFLMVFCYCELLILASNHFGDKKIALGEQTFGDIKGVVIGDYEENTQEKIEDEVKSGDARPLIIKKYLEKYKSPLAAYADLIFEVSQQNGYEYYWIVAIAQQESNLCKKIPEGSHNCWGYGIHSKGTLKFENYELAIKSFGDYLKRQYFDKGLNTAELIMKKYCPHSNGSWAYGVNQFIREMEEGSF